MTEVAGIYCRLSLARQRDIMGRTIIDTTKVEDQERICREIAQQRKWPVATGTGWPEANGAYVDNNRSAWQRGRKRPGWDKMLADVETGRLSHLIIYHGDRLVRQPYDLEQLINLADQRGMIIASATGDYRLDVPTDRFVLRILTAAACLSSDDTSRRKKAGFERMARSGIAPLPAGQSGRGFGYEADGRTPHPAEAAAIRKAAERILDGQSLTGIIRELNDSGVTAVSGRPLSYQAMRRILLRQRNAGLMPNGEPGSWEPILDRETWELLRAVLLGRTEQVKSGQWGGTWPGSTARHLLSGIATCYACGKPVQRSTVNGTFGYACAKPGCRKVHRNMALLDAYVGRRVVNRLNNAGNPVALVPERPGLAAELVTLTEARAELRAMIADPGQPYVDLLMTRLGRVEERIAGLRDSTGDAARARLAAAYQGITWEQWKALPLPTRRALVAGFWSVELLPASRRGPGFCEHDVRMIAL